MEHCRSPDGVTSVSVRPYYAMLSRVYLALAMGFLVMFEKLPEEHIQNRKYITYCNAARAERRTEPRLRATSIGNLLQIRPPFLGYAHRHTDKHAYHNTALPRSLSAGTE